MNATRYTLLGVEVSALTYTKLLNKLPHYFQTGGGYICVAAVHLIMEAYDNPSLRAGLNRAIAVTPDGMPLVFLLRQAGLATDRVYGPELMKKMCSWSVKKNRSIFLLGGRTGQTAQVALYLKNLWPALRIVGYQDTPQKILTADHSQKIIKKIAATKADFVFVGMGCPYQEEWMIKYHSLLPNKILIGVGAAFDFFAGYKKQAPILIQHSGFEWLFRFCQEPRRLWRRYLILNSKFLYLISLEIIISGYQRIFFGKSTAN